MGAPRRNRRKYDKPKKIWDLKRIKKDRELIRAYGLKNMKELWKVQSFLSKTRGNVRLLLSGAADANGNAVEKNIVAYLSKRGMLNAENPSLENILDMTEKDFLERRLQTVVFRHGLARSMKQARQLITHGFIAINGRKLTRPSYVVSKEEEKMVGYYKPIDISPPVQKEANDKADKEEESKEKVEGA